MTANKARKAAARQRMAETGERYSVAKRATASGAILNPEALARGHKLFVVPVQRTDEFPWYEIPDEYLARGFEDEDAILQFGGFWKGSGPRWTLFMDDAYDDDVYELGGEPENPPISEAIRHLNRVRKSAQGKRSSVPIGHVFISYVREDSPAVDRLQRILEAAGVRVWRDTANLWPGEDWKARIRHAITDGALVFLACFSSRSAARQKSYQNEELLLAIEQLRLRRPDDPWLIPVRFDDCDIPEYDIGGSRTLKEIQYADLVGDHFDDGATRLTETVKRILGRQVELTRVNAEVASGG